MQEHLRKSTTRIVLCTIHHRPTTLVLNNKIPGNLQFAWHHQSQTPTREYPSTRKLSLPTAIQPATAPALLLCRVIHPSIRWWYWFQKSSLTDLIWWGDATMIGWLMAGPPGGWININHKTSYSRPVSSSNKDSNYTNTSSIHSTPLRLHPAQRHDTN